MIRWFGTRGKLFNVHFRNIKGRKLDFMEAFPDEGDMDMARSLRVYQEVGYQYMLMPDHVPEIDGRDPVRHRVRVLLRLYRRADAGCRGCLSRFDFGLTRIPTCVRRRTSDESGRAINSYSSAFRSEEYTDRPLVLLKRRCLTSQMTFRR